MTKIMYNLLIIQAVAQDYPLDFLISRTKLLHRKDGYPKHSIRNGLEEAFTWLNTEVNKINYHRCILTLPDSSVREEELDPRQHFRKKQLAALYSQGCISYPYLKNIEVRTQKSNRFLLLITAASMATFWPYLYAFLKQLTILEDPIPPPPVLEAAHPEFSWNNIICVPEDQAGVFPSVQAEQTAGQFEETTPEPAAPSNEAHPSLKEIALKHAIEGRPITRGNRDEIAIRYGYKSGSKLYQYYCGFMKRSDRVADPDGSAKMMAHKIKLFENVSTMVDPEFKDKALEELGILRSIYNQLYE